MSKKLYPLVDFIYNPEHKKLKGIRTGEFRNPKKGEWYLSGAIPECYQAKRDMSSPYYIIQVVEVTQVVLTTYELKG